MANPESQYTEPKSLVIISSIFLASAACASLWIALDIVWRRGWKSMMGIMIPVYIINALYIYPVTLWVYLEYGRPPKPDTKKEATSHHHGDAGARQGQDETLTHDMAHNHHNGTGSNEHHNHHNEGHNHKSNDGSHKEMHGGDGSENHSHQQHHMGSDRSMPMFATVTAGVCHCGAGCVLGDIVGEWLVYGVHGSIAGRPLWLAYIVDFAFAIGFGIIFQYFSIAPMAGEYGPKTIWRAAKADILSLIFFQLGLFGWMAIYQIAIWRWKLEPIMVTYWWMMQIGMFLGHFTSTPINYWLIGTGIKEPCV